MKKVVFGPSGKLEDHKVVDVPALTAGPGQVVVTVRASAVNYGDIVMVKSVKPGTSRPDLTPGYEVAGIVKEVGPGVTDVKVGDRVAAFPGIGAYAEEVVAGAEFVYPVPAGMDFAVAASLSATYGTALHAFTERAKLAPGETVLILGASGGAGLTAVEVARLLGAHVIAAASTPEKLAICKQHGAHDLINYTSENLRARITELTGGKGIDVVFDPVGGTFIDPALKALKSLGRYLVIGFASGEPTHFHPGLLLVKQVSVIGVFHGEFLKAHPAEGRVTINQLIEWHTAGKITPLISQTFPLDQAYQAMRQLDDRKVTGKIILTP